VADILQVPENKGKGDV